MLEQASWKEKPMEHCKWDPKTKFQIVLEGLKTGASVSEICNRHQKIRLRHGSTDTTPIIRIRLSVI